MRIASWTLCPGAWNVCLLCPRQGNRSRADLKRWLLRLLAPETTRRSAGLCIVPSVWRATSCAENQTESVLPTPCLFKPSQASLSRSQGHGCRLQTLHAHDPSFHTRFSSPHAPRFLKPKEARQVQRHRAICHPSSACSLSIDTHTHGAISCSRRRTKETL